MSNTDRVFKCIVGGTPTLREAVRSVGVPADAHDIRNPIWYKLRFLASLGMKIDVIPSEARNLFRNHFLRGGLANRGFK